MKIYFLFLFLVLNLVASAQGTDSDTSRSVTRINRAMYSLAYPDSWTADTSKMFGVDLFLRSPKVDSLDQFIENINVFVQNLSGLNYDLNKMGKESEAQIKKMVTDIEILENRLDSSSKTPYYTLRYRGRQGKFLLITEQRYFLVNYVGFALTFTAQNGKEADYKLTAQAIFDSFNLL